MVEREQYYQYVNNIQHIQSVIQERINLFEKRKLEVKRYLKSTHRANIQPNASSLFILLDAEIRYVINKAIYPVLANILQDMQKKDQLALDVKENEQIIQYQELIQLLISDNNIHDDFRKQILTIKSEITSIVLKTKNLHQFLQVILNPDEGFQRKQLSIFIQECSSELLKEILENIAIFDSDFLILTDKLLKKYIIDFIQT